MKGWLDDVATVTGVFVSKAKKNSAYDVERNKHKKKLYVDLHMYASRWIYYKERDREMTTRKQWLRGIHHAPLWWVLWNVFGVVACPFLVGLLCCIGEWWVVDEFGWGCLFTCWGSVKLGYKRRELDVLDCHTHAQRRCFPVINLCWSLWWCITLNRFFLSQLCFSLEGKGRVAGLGKWCWIPLIWHKIS